MIHGIIGKKVISSTKEELEFDTQAGKENSTFSKVSSKSVGSACHLFDDWLRFLFGVLYVSSSACICGLVLS
jgi:hypothetical protein